MNENNLIYRLFVNFCVCVTIGLLAVMAEYVYYGENAVSLQSLLYILVYGAIIGIVFEILFVEIFPISGGNLRRNIIWRNRFIAAIINALIVAILGRLMLGGDSGFSFLLLISISACLIAVIVVGIISDIQYRHSVREMNRRLMELNGPVDKKETDQSV